MRPAARPEKESTMSDTMSNDPRRKAEAQRLAAEAVIPKTETAPVQAAPLPTLSYDPIALAREAWNKEVDPKYASKTFEEIWQSLNDLNEEQRRGAVVGAFTEEEFKQVVTSMMTSVQAFFLHHASESANERANARRTLVNHDTNTRLNVPGSTTCCLDVHNGVLRIETAPSTPTQRKCFLHPEGCPDDGPTMEAIAVPMGGAGVPAGVIQALMEAIQKRGRK